MSKHFDSNTGTFKPIPKAYCYVLSNDSFMSQWGHAKNYTNVCVVPCENWDIANRVLNYARSRGDQKHVRIVFNKPKTRKSVLYSLVERWVETSIPERTFIFGKGWGTNIDGEWVAD